MKKILITFILYVAAFLAGLGPARAAPPVTAGLVLHLDASAITGLDDGDKVAQWDDLSGCGNHAAQAVEANQPAYMNDVLSGKPVVRFDGTDCFATTLELANKNIAIFTVGRSAASNYGCYINHAGTAPYLRLWWGNETRSGVNRGLYIWKGDGGSYTYLEQNENTLGAWELGSLTVAANNYITIHSSGEPKAAGVIAREANWTVGVGGFGYRPLNGDIAEILIYNRALSDAEREAVEQYLGHKWMGWPAPPRSGAFITELF